MHRPFLLVLICCAVQGADDGPDIRFGLFENTGLDDGRHRSSALFLWHRTTNPDGSVDSSHLLNYVRAGEHRMLIPLWFQGPSYAAAPLALSVVGSAMTVGVRCGSRRCFMSNMPPMAGWNTCTC